MDSETSPMLNSFPDYRSSDPTRSAGRPHAAQEHELRVAEGDFIAVELDTSQPEDVDAVLKRCERLFLKPYRFVLQSLGWAKIKPDSEEKRWKVCRAVLVSFWLFFIITTFLTQVLSCFRRDVFPKPLNKTDTYSCSNGFVSNFVLTDVILLATYCYGIYLFHEDNEYLSRLAEDVFIKVSQVTFGKPRYSILWRIGWIFLFGLLWIVLSFVVRIIHIVAFHLFYNEIEWPKFIIPEDAQKFLTTYSIFGFVLFDIVYVWAVINYAAQCELIIDFIWAIRQKIQSKSYDNLDVAIKDIFLCRTYLHALNGKTATATGLVLFNLINLALISLYNLHKATEADTVFSNPTLLGWLAALNAILWVGLACVPFIQAVRVTNKAEKLVDLGPEIRSRPQFYTDTPLLELDSFIILTQAIKLRATIFGIPVHQWLGYGVLVVSTAVLLLLLQTGLLSFASYL